MPRRDASVEDVDNLVRRGGGGVGNPLPFMPLTPDGATRTPILLIGSVDLFPLIEKRYWEYVCCDVINIVQNGWEEAFLQLVYCDVDLEEIYCMHLSSTAKRCN